MTQYKLKTGIMSLFIVIGILGLVILTSALATIKVSGAHYNLNIIGAKNVGQIGASDGHSMFVNLQGKTKIIMTQDPSGTFSITDRNGLDGQAAFNIAPGHYNVYATSLGKPGGKVKISAYGNFTDAVDGSELILLGYVDLSRNKSKPQSVNINNLFYVDVTLCTKVDIYGNCTQTTVYNDYWVFDIPELLQYYWEYNNDGLKLLQVRFYPCGIDPTGVSSDYCKNTDGTPINPQKTVTG